MSELTFDHPTLGPVSISPMRDDELALVLSSWMHSSDWRRREMVAVVEAGGVLVARDDGGLALGWLATSGGRFVTAYCKQGFRGNGVVRLLWDAAGQPRELVDKPGNKRVGKVLASLIAGSK